MYKANGQGGSASVVSRQSETAKNWARIRRLHRLPCFTAANAIRYGVDVEGKTRDVIAVLLPVGD